MDKERFQPSLLRGLYRTESVPVSWDEVYRLITEDETVKQQTELYRSTHEEKYKHALPAVTTAVQLDGKGKAMENIVGYTGVTHCDLDHVPTERLSEVLEKIKADPHTFLCNVSPSVCGVHIYAKYSVEDVDLNANYQKINREFIEKLSIPSEENNFTDNLRIIDGNSRSQKYDMAFMSVNCYYADLLGLPFDEQCSNPNKTLSLSHDPDAYFNPNAEVFKVNANYQKISRELIEKLGVPSEENNFTKNLRTIDGNSRSYKEKHYGRYVKNYLDPIEAAVEYVERQGYTYTEGCRNAYLMRCLMHLNKLGVPQAEAERWALSHDGLPQREIMGIVRSCYRHTAEHGTYERPFEWVQEERPNSQIHKFTRPRYAHARDTDGGREWSMEESKCLSDNPALYVGQFLPFPEHQWPRFIQQMVDCGDSKPQRDVILLGSFCVLGAMLGSLVRFKYSHRYWHPCLQVFIVAPPASGKGVVSLVRHLAEPLHDKLMSQYEAAKRQYDKEKAVYDNAGRERVNLDIPQAPVQRMFLIAGNNSSTGILENLADAEGYALICESEADTLSAAINADYGNWDDTLRKAHDHDRLSYNRRTNKEYRQIQKPCMGVLICGTPAQVKPLIPSAENGLFSRQLFATLPSIDEFVDQFGDDEADLDSQFYSWGKEWLARLEKLRIEMSCIELELSAEQRQCFSWHFRRMFNHARVTQPNHHMKSSVVREAVNILRIMSVVALFRSMEESNLLVPAKDIPAENVKDGVATRYSLKITEADFNAVLALAEPIYRNACDILTLLPSTEAVRNSVTPTDRLLCNLPLEFNTAEAVEIGSGLGITKTNVTTILSRLCLTGRLTKVAHGRYAFG